ncbi:MAG TPA: UvrD-helicase domain-containing protein [Opitutaceae bacterium]|nr:UvrD-helicase domain-containing protein [Opitutaceae bacterium]
MSKPALVDQVARDRFRDEWNTNFAVSANAGSGKTTAISERLAALALSAEGSERLRKTAVVTYTKKAAAQIEQRARQVLLQRLAASGRRDLAPLDHLERAFFGTIHSFCLRLAQLYGQTVGINLNPVVVAEDDTALWEEFVEQDPMEFTSLSAEAQAAFLRHVPLESIFGFAKSLDAGTAAALRAHGPTGLAPVPSAAALEQLLALPAKGGGQKNLLQSQQRARAWQAKWERGEGFLPLYEPSGKAAAVVRHAEAWMQPLKRWLAEAAAVLAAELAERYRAWRFTRGVQTYADQIDAAMAVLRDDALLDRLRGEGWRVILDEAQDTDPQQFAVLVELARPPGAPRGTWPGPGSRRTGPRPGHFCMVGDGQQAIYGRRADIANFTRHVDAFRQGDGGELLEFQVTFRAPRTVITLLNGTLPAAFGPEQAHNFGLPPAEGAPAPRLQVDYVPLEAGPANVDGRVGRIPLVTPAVAPRGVEAWLAEEARQVAEWLHRHGPAAVGAERWGDVAVLAPRNEWLSTARKAFERAGLQVALQTRRNRNGDHPVYAWLAGLLAVCADPENTFEWVGVLREVFAVSDGLIAAELHRHGRLAWDEPTVHAAPLADALALVRPHVMRINDEGRSLATFALELAAAAGLADKARRLDPTGGLAAELDRLLAQAAELGLQGLSPRGWLAELLAHLEDGRPAGKPTADAVNLLTSHSAKGLEWPVVIVLGLWRGIGRPTESGLRLVRDPGAAPRVYFDQDSLPADTRESRDRERTRELTRLLYVTLTRPRRALIVPWADDFGGPQREKPSFAELWATDLAVLPELDGTPVGPAGAGGAPTAPESVPAFAAVAAKPVAGPTPLPARLLPHQLAHAPDTARLARHEASAEEPWAPEGGDDPIRYGLWWHETMERLPWLADEATLDDYGAKALASAEAQGIGPRAGEEWRRLRASAPWRDLRDPRWKRRAEIGIFAPLRTDAWIDGVIDLLLHDPAAGEVWVVDWKTNRRHGDESDADFLARLVAEYAPQLSAYGQCLAGFFAGCRVRRLVYSSVAGQWSDVPDQKF